MKLCSYGSHNKREKGMPITSSILQEKTLIFQKELNEGEPDLRASVGWLDHWEHHMGQGSSVICGQKLSANTCHYLNFKAKFHSLIKESRLLGEQI